ncbi:MAG TPA: methyl-accepting chemotaxis protein [Burkholderiaceae bacterium]
MTHILRNLKIGQRLALGFGLMLALLLAMAALSINRISELKAGMEDIVNVRHQHASAAHDMYAAINRSSASVRDLILFTAPDQRERVLRELGDARAHYDDAERRLLRQMSQPTRTEQDLLALIERSKSMARPIADSVGRLVRADQMDEAKRMLAEESLPAQMRWIEAVRQLASYSEKEAAELAAVAMTGYGSMRELMLASAALAVVFGVAAAWVLTLSITRPINEAVQVAQQVAGGDLGVDIPAGGRDEPAQLLGALKTMAEALTGLVAQVHANSDSIASGSSQIANGNEDLSHRTEQQASSLQQTAASMEQLSGTVRNTADTARQASQLATAASQAAEEGGRVVDGVVSTMAGISVSSRRINDIIGVIDGIAFQTNILALNAAVEAARAGEQGRGFAVVAGEVRSLAQRSAEAAREIKALIGESVGKVDGGSKLVAEAGRTMNDIVTQVKRVSDMIGEISSAAQEQTLGISQVGQAITQLDQVTQQNAALVEQLAAAATNLKSRAGELVGSVQQFRLADGMPAGVPFPVAMAHPVRTGAAPTPKLPRVAPRSLAAPPVASASPRPTTAAGADDDWTQF